jgi:hypothetical protein
MNGVLTTSKYLPIAHIPTIFFFLFPSSLPGGRFNKDFHSPRRAIASIKDLPNMDSKHSHVHQSDTRLESVDLDGVPTNKPNEAQVDGVHFMEDPRDRQRDQGLRQRRTISGRIARNDPTLLNEVTESERDPLCASEDDSAQLSSNDDSALITTSQSIATEQTELGPVLVNGALHAVCVVGDTASAAVLNSGRAAAAVVREICDWRRRTINKSHESMRQAASARNTSAGAMPTDEVVASGIKRLLMRVCSAKDLYSPHGGKSMDSYMFGMGTHSVHYLSNMRWLPPLCSDKTFWYHSFSSRVKFGTAQWDEVFAFEPLYSFDSQLYVCVKEDMFVGKCATIGRITIPLRALLTDQDMTTTGPGAIHWYPLANLPHQSGGELLLAFKFE